MPASSWVDASTSGAHDMTDQKRKAAPPSAVADVLASVFQGKPLGRRLKEARIWQVWDHAVGKQISAHARPVKFNSGILTVAVTSAPWMQQLTFLKDAILEKLNNALGEPLVTGIYLKAGRAEPTIKLPASSINKKAKLTQEKEKWIATEIASLNDQELRTALGAVMRKALAEQEK